VEHGLEHLRNLWICDLRINKKKFADCDFQTCIPKKFADLR
jgi:hypothetical protein